MEMEIKLDRKKLHMISKIKTIKRKKERRRRQQKQQQSTVAADERCAISQMSSVESVAKNYHYSGFLSQTR